MEITFNLKKEAPPKPGQGVCEVKPGQMMQVLPDDERLARLAKALAHPVRVAIVRYLLSLGECVCTDLTEIVPKAHSTAMQHLKVLKEAGLICSVQDGRNVYYGVDPTARQQLKALINEL